MEKIPQNKKKRVIYVTPQGIPFTQAKARELAAQDELLLLCGHYEGIDERVLEEVVTDYILFCCSYFTSITRYLLVDQNICGLLMRSTYCLLASCCRVYELDGCMVRMRADLE